MYNFIIGLLLGWCAMGLLIEVALIDDCEAELPRNEQCVLRAEPA